MILTVVGGAGHVGLVAATCFAENGNTVVCHDLPGQLAVLREGRLPFYEPRLQELFTRNVGEGRLVFCDDLAEAVQRAPVCIVAIPTPRGEGGRADLGILRCVVRDIADAMNGPKIIVLKSTVPVGTADLVREEISERSSYACSVVSSPEFMKEGSAVDDFLKPDRVIIGAAEPETVEVMTDLYSPFVRTGNPIIAIDNRSAELSKYAVNAHLATRISFINELANVAEAVGANVDNVRRALTTDGRIGPSFLFPGIGWGGSCFSKDVAELEGLAVASKVEPILVRAVRAVNESQRLRLFHKIGQHYGALNGRRFAVWGLAFKPETDDMRDAPAQALVEALLSVGAAVRVFDPKAMKEARRIFGDRVEYAENKEDALSGADALIVATEWNQFRHPDFAVLRKLLAAPVIFDGRNVFDPHTMAREGFRYFSIGRPDVG